METTSWRRGEHFTVYVLVPLMFKGTYTSLDAERGKTLLLRTLRDHNRVAVGPFQFQEVEEVHNWSRLYVTVETEKVGP